MANRPAWVANYIPKLIGEGLSPTAALRMLRAPEAEGGFGLSIRTQTWYQLWGATLAQLQAQERISTLPLNRRPPADLVSTVKGVRSTGFVTHVDLLVKDPTTGEFFYTPTAVRSERPISVGNAINQAALALTTAAVNQDPRYPSWIVFGGQVTGATNYV